MKAIAPVLGNYGNKSDGDLRVTACSDGRCVTGSADLAQSRDNLALPIYFDSPLSVTRTAMLDIAVQKVGGTNDVVLWLFPLAVPEKDRFSLEADGGVPAGFAPSMTLITGFPPEIAYEDSHVTIYQIKNVKNYFSSPECDVRFSSREAADVVCPNPGRLDRLELHYPGWVALVDGTPVPIENLDGAFQSVSLRTGSHIVEFRYAPWWLGPSLYAAGGALVLVLTGLLAALWRNLTMRPKFSLSESANR